MSRLKILQKILDQKLGINFDSVKQANRQPLNDKLDGASRLAHWESQNNSIRTQLDEIEKTERAIKHEMRKQANVDKACVTEVFKPFVESGRLIQWRKDPRFFFVAGVEKAIISITSIGGEVFLVTRDYSDIPTQEQKELFKTVCNEIKDDLGNLKHMLAANLSKDQHGSRNYFAASDQHDDSMTRLQNAGCVLFAGGAYGFYYFYATEKGMDAVGLSKSAKKRALKASDIFKLKAFGCF